LQTAFSVERADHFLLIM